MTPRRSFLVCVCALVPMLVACGASTPLVSDTGGQGVSTTSSSVSSDSSAALPSVGGSSRAGSIDVCALLSQTDAAEVARKRGLNGAQTAATQYTLTATKVDNSGNAVVPTSSCKFSIDGQGASGTVVIEVVSADNFSAYTDGEKVPGLGDEAFSGGGTTVVRVGDLMLQTAENSFTEGFVVDLYRKMVPKLK